MLAGFFILIVFAWGGVVLNNLSVYLQNPVAWLAVPLFVLYITRWQILPEERALSVRFPEAYARFRQRVRRWL